jgi:hypothetical protein
VGKTEGRRALGKPRRRWENNIKMYLWEVRWRGEGGIDWIDLVHDRDMWRALVYTMMNFGFHKMRGISWVAQDILACQEGLCSVELVSYWMVNTVSKPHLYSIYIQHNVCIKTSPSQHLYTTQCVLIISQHALKREQENVPNNCHVLRRWKQVFGAGCT